MAFHRIDKKTYSFSVPRSQFLGIARPSQIDTGGYKNSREPKPTKMTSRSIAILLFYTFTYTFFFVFAKDR